MSDGDHGNRTHRGDRIDRSAHTDASDTNGSSDTTDTSHASDTTDTTGTTARNETFLCDVMLGSLVSYLRMCGYDAAYALDRGVEADDRLLDIARAEDRTLLTRDRRLAARAQASRVGEADGEKEGDDGEGAATDVNASDGSARGTSGVGSVLLESHDVTDQLRELRDADYTLTLAEQPARCGRCNGPVDAVAEDEDTPEYAPNPSTRAVWRCVECSQCFWKGSHWASVERTLAGL